MSIFRVFFIAASSSFRNVAVNGNWFDIGLPGGRRIEFDSHIDVNQWQSSAHLSAAASLLSSFSVLGLNVSLTFAGEAS